MPEVQTVYQKTLRCVKLEVPQFSQSYRTLAGPRAILSENRTSRTVFAIMRSPYTNQEGRHMNDSKTAAKLRGDMFYGPMAEADVKLSSTLSITRRETIQGPPERSASSGHQPILQCPLEDSPVPTGGRCSGHWSAVRCPPHRSLMPTCAPAGGHVTHPRQGYLQHSPGKSSISLLYRFLLLHCRFTSDSHLIHVRFTQGR